MILASPRAVRSSADLELMMLTMSPSSSSPISLPPPAIALKLYRQILYWRHRKSITIFSE